VYGVREDDDVVNTVNTGKPRSFADVVYRSKLFQKLPPPPEMWLSTTTVFSN
jgi:hypothetical protein